MAMGGQLEKFCKECNKMLPLTEEYWYAPQTRPKCKQNARRYSAKTREHKVQKSRMYYIQNKEKLLAYKKVKYSENPELYIAKQKLYILNQKTNQPDLYRKNLRRKRDKIRSTVLGKLQSTIRARFNSALRSKLRGGRAIEALGCSVDEFKLYLESKFQPGMSWENYGRSGWHIDHKLPLGWFDLTNWKHVAIVCHYSNLQPLWAQDNYKKGAR